MDDEYSYGDVISAYPVGMKFLTFVGDSVQVVGYRRQTKTGRWQVSVTYPGDWRSVAIEPFNGHKRTDGTTIELVRPQDVCENDTMAL